MQNHKKHHLRAPLRYIIHIHTWCGLPTNQYICTSKFFFNTHLLTTYLPRISTNNNQRYIYLPQIKFHPNRSNPVPTYLVHSTHLTGPHTYQYYIPIYTGVGGGGPQAGSVPDCNRNFRL